jgi:hypothetical protein
MNGLKIMQTFFAATLFIISISVYHLAYQGMRWRGYSRRRALFFPIPGFGRPFVQTRRNKVDTAAWMFVAAATILPFSGYILAKLLVPERVSHNETKKHTGVPE